MKAFQRKLYVQSQISYVPNRWDILAVLIVFSLLIALAWGSMQFTTPFHPATPPPIDLSPLALPNYAIRTVLRLSVALAFSLLATFIFGALAAKSRQAERWIIPLVDILQSVPILGFLSVSSVLFMQLFPGSMLGPECAAIFVIFTSQAWNMILSFYQSLKTLPGDLKEATQMMRLSGWARFWKLEVPYAMPSLLWNTMMSLSASWFFVVASEVIPAMHHEIRLPGIGSYIAAAIDQANGHAIFYAIVAMFTVILIYDQVLFRPLVAWAEKFKMDMNPNENFYTPWFTQLMRKTYLLKVMGQGFTHFSNAKLFNVKKVYKHPFPRFSFPRLFIEGFNWLVQAALVGLLVWGTVLLFKFIVLSLPLSEWIHVISIGMVTALRVFILIVISSLLWVPVGVWIGMRPDITRIAQPVAQFFASFPANLLFPIVVFFVVKYQLNVNIWLTPLMILGTQWYILFNVIAGASNLPKELLHATAILGVKKILWWKRLVLPAIFPYFITGAITAAGGAWNASIVAEYAQWGDTTLQATGLGAYIAEYTAKNDFPRIALGVTVMCSYVLVLNRLFWQPLYRLAEKRFQVD